MMFGGMFASCNFLDKEPTKLTLENYFNTAEEANSFLTAASNHRIPGSTAYDCFCHGYF